MLKSDKRGFSLLEILITIAVLSGGLVVILQAITFSAKNAGLSVERVDAILWAQDRLALAEFYENQGLLPQMDINLQEKGIYSCALSLIEDPDTGADRLKIKRLELKVGWKNRAQERELRFRTSLRQFDPMKS